MPTSGVTYWGGTAGNRLAYTEIEVAGHIRTGLGEIHADIRCNVLGGTAGNRHAYTEIEAAGHIRTGLGNICIDIRSPILGHES